MTTARKENVGISRQNIIKYFYESRMGGSRPDFEVVGWGTEEVQIGQFDILTTYIPLENKRILDVGCGLGNLLEYLIKKEITVDYTGVDLLESMILRARKKKLNGWFLGMDIFRSDFFEKGSFDVVYSSGLFNLNLANNKIFFIRALRKFLDLSRETVVISLLHDRSRLKKDIYFYFNPQEVQEMIEKNFGSNIAVQIAEGYLSNDFTVILNRKTL